METLHATVTREALAEALESLVAKAGETTAPFAKLKMQVALLRALIADCPNTVTLTIPNVFAR